MNRAVIQPPHVLVIAYGNPLRQDDGAGLALADRLASHWRSSGISVEQITTHQLVPELAAEIAESSATAVVYVDTARAVAPKDDRFGIEVCRLAEPAAHLAIGHQINPALIQYMAHHLYGVESLAWLVTIPGLSFGHGEGLSHETASLLAESSMAAHEIMAQFAPGECGLRPHHVARQSTPLSSD